MACKRPAACEAPASRSSSSPKAPPRKRPAAATTTTTAVAANPKVPRQSPNTSRAAKKGRTQCWPPRFAFGARSFEEEKRIVLEKAAELQQLEETGWGSDNSDEEYLGEEFFLEVDRLSVEARRDRDIATTVLALDGTMLGNFCREFRNDPEIVLASIHDVFSGLCMASKELLSSRSFVLRAVAKNGTALVNAGHEFCSDREVVQVAVQNNGHALRNASADLRADKEIVLDAVRSKGRALWHASPDLQKEREVVVEAVSQDGAALEFATAELRADKDVVLKAVTVNGFALRHASSQLRAEKEVVLAAVSNYGGALFEAADNLRSDREVVMAAVKECWSILPLVKGACATDKDIFLWAARWCEEEDDKRIVYDQGGRPLSQNASLELFLRASRAALAIPGQQAPVLTASLSRICRPDGTSCFHCAASMMSGTSLFVDVPDLDRPAPCLEGLASHLVDLLQKHSEVEDVSHIFLTFDMGDGEYLSATPWDCDRPLSDFLARA